MTWSVLDAAGPVAQRAHRIDNMINDLGDDEIFTLKPGESQALLSWIPPIAFSRPGRLRAVLHYVNDPARRWTGLNANIAAAMKRVRHTSACDLVSDPVDIVVAVRSAP